LTKLIFISKLVSELILEIISRETSFEKVALVFGNSTGHHYFIEELKELKNIDESSTSFAIKPEEMIREISIYEKKGKSLVGFFHTHPDEEDIFPSKKDIFYMKFWPCPYIWIIGGNKKSPEFKIFTFSDSKVKELSYEISS